MAIVALLNAAKRMQYIMAYLLAAKTRLPPPLIPPPKWAKKLVLVNCDILSQYKRMDYVNYIALACSIAALGLSLIAGARVGKFINSTQNTDWETLANLTGDIAALKRTCQTLNNRLNGMNKATIPQEQIIQQMLEHQNVEPIRRGG